MEYPVITLRNSQKMFELMSKSGTIMDSNLIEFRGHGQSIEEILENLDVEIGNLVKKEGSIKQGIDAKLRPIVHSNLSNLEPEILGDRDFWRYLSAVRFFSLVSQRHQKTRKSSPVEGLDGNLANFGCLREEVKESLIYRLYFGADLSYDATNRKDPYHLARIHDVDLWQSHIIRVMSGDNPVYVRALVEWFRDRDLWYAQVQKDLRTKKALIKYSDGLETRHLRDLVKRIRRLRSNVIHEYLTYEEIKRMVSTEAEASLEDIAKWGKEKVVKVK
jgi:hypothetical protein